MSKPAKAKKPKPKPKPDPVAARFQTYTKRTMQMYHNHKARAAAQGQWVTYTSDELRLLVRKALDWGACAYCQRKLDEANFSADHRVPVSRLGSWGLENLVICCLDCNTAKGPLDYVEWRQLLSVMAEWSPAVRQHTLSRLKAGARLVKAGQLAVTVRPADKAKQNADERARGLPAALAREIRRDGRPAATARWQSTPGE
jgi:5-methylcytosine-specific restriction endonuclease McrA